jgi:hypothetical protein
MRSRLVVGSSGADSGSDDVSRILTKCVDRRRCRAAVVHRRQLAGWGGTGPRSADQPYVRRKRDPDGQRFPAGVFLLQSDFCGVLCAVQPLRHPVHSVRQSRQQLNGEAAHCGGCGLVRSEPHARHRCGGCGSRRTSDQRCRKRRVHEKWLRTADPRGRREFHVGRRFMLLR